MRTTHDDQPLVAQHTRVDAVRHFDPRPKLALVRALHETTSPRAGGVNDPEPDKSSASWPSRHLIICSHAQLAERLAENIDRLRKARLAHNDTREARDQLEAVVAEDLVSHLQAEEDALQAIAGAHRRGSWRSARAQRHLRRELREHRRLIRAGHELGCAETTVQALARAEDLRALLFAHLAEEDHELVRAAVAGPDEDLDRASITTELEVILAHDHARITDAVIAAREAAVSGSDDEMGTCDRAVAAVSQHAAVMSTRVYPMTGRRRSGPDRATTRALTDDLRNAERAMRHLHRSLRGAAGEDASLRNRTRLWNDVEQSWQRHVASEEVLMHQVAPLLGPGRDVSLIGLLRRPVARSLTRPHPQLLRGGWPTRLAIRAQYRFDRWRDGFDSRDTWR